VRLSALLGVESEATAELLRALPPSPTEGDEGGGSLRGSLAPRLPYAQSELSALASECGISMAQVAA